MTTDATEAAAAAAAAALPVRRRGFFGWQIVLVAFTAQLVASGVTLSVVGNLVAPMNRAFGLEGALLGVGVAPAFAILMIGMLGPFLGRWLDRGWTRPLMILGAGLTGAGLILLSMATEVWQLVVVYVGMVCTGGALFGVLPSTTLIANWFVRRRGLMLGVAYAGATLASAAGPLFAQTVIDAEGWRAALRYLGIFTWVSALPIMAAFVIGRPEDVGQLPDGALEDLSSDRSVPADPAERARPAAELARDPVLWQVAIGFGLVMTSPLVILSLVIDFGQSTLGLTGQQATFFFLAAAPLSLVGKLLIGGLADVAPLRPSIALTVLLNVLVWMILYTNPSYPVFVATGALYGIGIGGAAPLHGVVNGRCFGRANFGMAAGLGGIAGIPLMVAAVILGQVLKGVTGSYHASFLVQGVLLLLGGALLACVPIPPPAHEPD